jgi:hypothetical protein
VKVFYLSQSIAVIIKEGFNPKLMKQLYFDYLQGTLALEDNPLFSPLKDPSSDMKALHTTSR